VSWKDFGWSDEYTEPSLSDLDPRNWNPFDFSWDQSMFNPDNPDAAKDVFWMDVGLSVSMASYLFSAYNLGFYAAWDTAGGWLMARRLSTPWRVAGVVTNPAIMVPAAVVIGATVLNEFTRQSISEEHEGSDMSNFGYTTPFTSGLGTVV